MVDVKPWTRFRVLGDSVRPMLRDGLPGPMFDDYGSAANWADQANTDYAAWLARQEN